MTYGKMTTMHHSEHTLSAANNGCFCAQKHKFPPSKNSSFSVIAFALAVFQVSSFVTNIAVAICHIF